MASARQTVLVDNCAISACADAGGWKALVHRYQVETVEEVASEAGTGYQHREIIDPAEFRAEVTIHPVTRDERLERQAEHAGLGVLDDGERDLWIHALGRADGWILCGPDAASMRFGVRAGLSHRLISLEELLEKIGHSTKGLQPHHTKRWLRDKISAYTVELVSDQTKAADAAKGNATPKRGKASGGRR
ncbi:hypothetical protein ABID82_007152 [Methylobacterium sp. PvP062]|uniref:Nucleic acid-binding protein n=1 Tax=Methylobacterium radiotolerans TaxID=31998 RepID=A0ABV2NTX6_9HYPH|nr:MULTISPECIES: hypothetical protein [unclassified Methylobacterium]MBP2498325.1 hypothetical protein [Methylobacterium sp. PvP105]MBP2505709.1 hypothetical protein [Methylobacterium sp. PvP109]